MSVGLRDVKPHLTVSNPLRSCSTLGGLGFGFTTLFRGVVGCCCRSLFGGSTSVGTGV